MEMTKKDAQIQLELELEKLLKTAPENMRETVRKDFEGFKKLFNRFLQEVGPSFEWDKIETLPKGAVIDYNTLQEPVNDKIRTMLDKLVVSLFIHFNTFVVVFSRYLFILIHLLSHPRFSRESFMPVAKSVVGSDLEVWYPPGHGDFYESFYNSGLLDELLNCGAEFCFVSNIDNLGATVDINILNLLLNPSEKMSTPEFVMEVTDKTRADVKGGTLIQYEGKLRLMEIAQVPKEHIDDFKSVKTFKIFNTNNLWVRLSAIKHIIEDTGMHMEIIVNHKSLDNGMNVIQLETASGAAVKNFNGALGINVPRSRFLPVKKTSDLLLVMSNLYSIRNGSLDMSPMRSFPSVPLVKLGDNHFAKVRDFLKRFASIPDMLELDHLTVSGDVTFGKDVSLRGTVIIIANHGDRIDIPSGAILENKIVSGNLRILDH
uniref:UTP--glucose-1-phosphate uridylyltransferase n=1 Tax=Strigamia maritima TaxID=126957 RepID=T1JGE7_STRMM